MRRMRVVLVSTFGKPAYGVSPYANQLISSLRDCEEAGDSIEPLDYQKPYPDFLYPAKAPKRQRTVGLHWAKPATWKCPMPAPDVLHIQYWTQIMAPMLVRLALSAKRYGVRIVVTVHNAQPHESSGFFARFEHTLLELADAIITHIPDASVSSVFGVKHHVIPHGIHFRSPEAASRADYELTGLSETRRYVLFFGNIRPYKGLIDLLHAWSDIVNDFPDHDLLVAGRLWSGSTWLSRLSGKLLGLRQFEREYRAACRLVPPGRAHFAENYLSEEYIDAVSRISELAVFPYRSFDAQSGAATRVAGLGRTLLVSDKGGLARLVPSNRYIFPGANVESLKAKLRVFLERNPESIRQDETRQREHLSDHAWSAVASKHWELYRALSGGDR